MIVGEVARHAPTQNWFAARPLFGQTILVTRPADQAGEMATPLAAMGAGVVCQPAIEIAPPDDWSGVDQAIQQLSIFDWIVFSSRNGVRYFLDRVGELGQDPRALAGVRIAAIGPATVAQLAKYSLRADLCPEIHRAEALAEAFGGSCLRSTGAACSREPRTRSPGRNVDLRRSGGAASCHLY